MIAEAGVYRDEVHARHTSRNPTAFAAEQGLPASGISQYEDFLMPAEVRKLNRSFF